MTIQGAVYELERMLLREDIPDYIKPTIKKIIETVVDEFSNKQVDKEGDELLTPDERANVLNVIDNMLKEQGFNLEVCGYEDTNGVIFNVLFMRGVKE